MCILQYLLSKTTMVIYICIYIYNYCNYSYCGTVTWYGLQWLACSGPQYVLGDLLCLTVIVVVIGTLLMSTWHKPFLPHACSIITNWSQVRSTMPLLSLGCSSHVVPIYTRVHKLTAVLSNAGCPCIKVGPVWEGCLVTAGHWPQGCSGKIRGG